MACTGILSLHSGTQLLTKQYPAESIPAVILRKISIGVDIHGNISMFILKGAI